MKQPAIVIVCTYDDSVGVGKDPKEAYENLTNLIGEETPLGDCTFYDAVEFSVEMKIERKETLVRK